MNNTSPKTDQQGSGAQIKLYSKSGRIPEYKTPEAAGMDIEAFFESADDVAGCSGEVSVKDDCITLGPGARCAVPTGLFAEIQPGYEIQIRARSGLAFKHGIGLTNGIGTIDSDYRGEIKVLLINQGDRPFEIRSGDRIAQMVVARYETASVIKVGALDELTDTDRSDGGFGHTGV